MLALTSALALHPSALSRLRSRRRQRYQAFCERQRRQVWRAAATTPFGVAYDELCAGLGQRLFSHYTGAGGANGQRLAMARATLSGATGVVTRCIGGCCLSVHTISDKTRPKSSANLIRIAQSYPVTEAGPRTGQLGHCIFSCLEFQSKSPVRLPVPTVGTGNAARRFEVHTRAL